MCCGKPCDAAASFATQPSERVLADNGRDVLANRLPCIVCGQGAEDDGRGYSGDAGAAVRRVCEHHLRVLQTHSNHHDGAPVISQMQGVQILHRLRSDSLQFVDQQHESFAVPCALVRDGSLQGSEQTREC